MCTWNLNADGSEPDVDEVDDDAEDLAYELVRERPLIDVA